MQAIIVTGGKQYNVSEGMRFPSVRKETVVMAQKLILPISTLV